MDKLLADLNEAQREAVTATEGYVRVVAGAGTGKTKTLSRRFVYLAEALGISPAAILCVTFTNHAAAEMKRRIRALHHKGMRLKVKLQRIESGGRLVERDCGRTAAGHRHG